MQSLSTCFQRMIGNHFNWGWWRMSKNLNLIFHLGIPPPDYGTRLSMHPQGHDGVISAKLFNFLYPSLCFFFLLFFYFSKNAAMWSRFILKSTGSFLPSPADLTNLARISDSYTPGSIKNCILSVRNNKSLVV